jgi:5-methyltetrahydrofolate corrinoid/iron sulfur protein methyltransferase
MMPKDAVKTKSNKEEDMLIIGENITIGTDEVQKAITERDAETIQKKAVSQVEHGAGVLDLNIGPQKRHGAEVMGWIVDAVQEVVDVPLCLDTTNAAALEAGLKRCEKQATINSTSAEPERLENIMPLAAKYNAKVIALTMGKTIPSTTEGRAELAMEVLIPKALELGIPMQDLYLDPLVLTVQGMQDYAPQTLEALRYFKQMADPPPMTVVGLSNISNDVPWEQRSLINRTYLVMLMAAGLDAAIANPLDEKQNEFIRIVEERDTSTPVGELLVNLYDATAAMEELDPALVDMDDPDQVAIWKTVRILENKVIYAHGYLKA